MIESECLSTRVSVHLCSERFFSTSYNMLLNVIYVSIDRLALFGCWFYHRFSVVASFSIVFDDFLLCLPLLVLWLWLNECECGRVYFHTFCYSQKAYKYGICHKEKMFIVLHKIVLGDLQFDTAVIQWKQNTRAITIRFNYIFCIFEAIYLLRVRIKWTPFNSEIEFQIHLIHIIVRKNWFSFPKGEGKRIYSQNTTHIVCHTENGMSCLRTFVRTNVMKFGWNKNDDFFFIIILYTEHVCCSLTPALPLSKLNQLWKSICGM